jgi:hypothetical protein
MAAQTVAVALVVDASTTQTSGAADPAPYSKMMAEDRAVKSVAYEVFRFGAHELTDGDLLQPSSETCLLSTSSPSGRVSAELRRSSAITLQLGPSPRLELIAVVSQPGSSRRAAWSGQH